VKKITEQTSITLSLGATVISGVIALAIMYQKVEAHEQKLQDKNTFERSVIDRLARMEEKLDFFLKNK
jgi:F0F1-type ATP synthase membrane subunit a